MTESPCKPPPANLREEAGFFTPSWCSFPREEAFIQRHSCLMVVTQAPMCDLCREPSIPHAWPSSTLDPLLLPANTWV
jgi:hypothetical protein